MSKSLCDSGGRGEGAEETMSGVSGYTFRWWVCIKHHHEMVPRRASQEAKGSAEWPVGYLTPIGTGWEKGSSLHLIARSCTKHTCMTLMVEAIRQITLVGILVNFLLTC